MAKRNTHTSAKDAKNKLLIRNCVITCVVLVAIALCIALFAGGKKGPSYTDVDNDYTQETSSNSGATNSTDSSEDENVEIDELPKLPVD